jgi:polyisoprenoid-binding protein YceI
MRRASLFFGIMLATFSAFSQTWVSDPAHSRLGFSVKHLLISEVAGNFKKFEVKAVTAKPDYSDAKIDVTAEISTINTDNEQRDTHLKSAAFFDVAQFSTLTFKSTAVKSVGANKYKLTGNLTLHGITKPTTLNLVFAGKTSNPMNKKVIAVFSLNGVVKRADFVLGPKFPAAMISEEVMIAANIEMSPVE